MIFDFVGWLHLAEEYRGRARVKRTHGDALRKLGKIEAAKEAYRAAAEDLRACLDTLPGEILVEIRDRWPLERVDQSRRLVDELVELYGSLGGVLRRDEDHHEALASYERGATIEQDFDLMSTYNRLNAIKCKLLIGTATLDELEPDLNVLARQIEQQLATDAKLSDSGWAWADLGECRLLMGDLVHARQAYRIFVSKAEPRSPTSLLGVLTEIARTLEGATDPKALRAAKDIDLLKREFA